MSRTLESLKNEMICLFGDNDGTDFFESFIKPANLLKIEMALIKYDFKHYSKTFTEIILPKTEKFNKKLSKLHNENELFHSMTEASKNNEILSLAYMGLYHKIENYENRILWHYNSITQSNKKKIEDIGVNLENKKISRERNRIRLICNSIKHNNCFPKKGLLKYYKDLDLNKNLDLTKLEFKNDIELTIKFINSFNIIILSKLLEQSINNIEEIENSKLLSATNDFKKTISNFFIHLNKENEEQTTPRPDSSDL